MIPIRNIYYMLSYSFSILRENGYKSIAAEKFKNTADICAAILIKAISLQLKKGMIREYESITELCILPRGKIEISDTIKTMNLKNPHIVCTYDEFSLNSYLNRIIKTTVEKLIGADISASRKKTLKKLILYFSNVNLINPGSINWNTINIYKNQTDNLIITICYLIVNGLIQTTSDGNIKMLDYFDEQRMCRLYEKFILGYYRKEFPELNACAAKIKWQIDGEGCAVLPDMRSDIMLSDKSGKNILIIEAKYYSKITSIRYGKHILNSNNIYQIFAYVKNKEYELMKKPHNSVSGMLLYARTDDEVLPDADCNMSGNMISIKTLDLNSDFEKISSQLNLIAERLKQGEMIQS